MGQWTSQVFLHLYSGKSMQHLLYRYTKTAVRHIGCCLRMRVRKQTKGMSEKCCNGCANFFAWLQCYRPSGNCVPAVHE